LTIQHIRGLFLAALVGATLAPQLARAQSGATAPPAWVQQYLSAEHQDHFAHAWVGRAAMLDALRNGPQAGAPAQYNLRGTFRVAVLAATYSDYAPTVSTASVDGMLFSPAGANGKYSLTSFYRENSAGRFTVAGTVTPWMTLPQPTAYYGRVIKPFIHDVLVKADSTVDWRQYDNDGPDGIPNSGDDDGYVDLAILMHPLSDGVCSTGSLRGPTGTGWGVSRTGAFSTGAFVTRQVGANGQHIRIEDFVLAAGLNCSGSGVASVNITAHEMGHALGLPDLYDLDWSSYGVGAWDLMGYGLYATDGRPSLMSAWSRARLGWMDVTTVSGDGRLVIPAAETTPSAYRINIPGTSEYLLLENRQRTGADAGLPGSGLLVWHVDEAVLAARLPVYGANEDELHPGLSLLQADGRKDLLLRANLGDAGDAFTGAGLTQLTDVTLPSASANAGGASNIRLRNITMTAAGVSLDVMLTGSLANDPVTSDPDGTRIMQQLLRHTGLTAGEKAWLDANGNHDGAFNVGDVQAWMSRHGGPAGAGLQAPRPVPQRSGH